MNWWHYYKESIGAAIVVLTMIAVIYVMVDAILAIEAVMLP